MNLTLRTNLSQREAKLNQQIAAFSRRQAIATELEYLVWGGKISLVEKTGLLAVFAAIPNDLEVSFVAPNGKTQKQFGCEVLWSFLNDLEPRYSSVTFAATHGKKKNCVKGISCGNGCISSNKTCRKPLTPIQKEQVKEVLAIVHIPRISEPEPKTESTSRSKSTSKSKPLSERERIDLKYAEQMMSGKGDVKSWIKERVAYDSEPTDENALRNLQTNLKTKARDREGYISEVVKRVKKNSEKPISALEQSILDLMGEKREPFDEQETRIDAGNIFDEAIKTEKQVPKNVREKYAELHLRSEMLRSMKDASPVDSMEELAEKYLSSHKDVAVKMFGLKPGASVADIKKRYRELASKAHPDAGGSAEEFRRVQTMYQQMLKQAKPSKSASFSAFSTPNLKALLSSLNEEIKAELKVNPSVYPNLVKLINGTYSDGIDSIVSARVEDDRTIIAIVRDGQKQLAVKIANDEIMIRVIPSENNTAQMSAHQGLNRLLRREFWDEL